MGMSEHEKPNKGHSDIWLTPLSIIEEIGPFDLDPCGFKWHKTADFIYETDGLDTPWFGRVWINPPYSQVSAWLSRLAEHGHGVALVFARTDTKWAQKFILLADQIFFPKGRIKFNKPNETSKWTSGAPSMFLSFGEHTDFKMPGIKFINNPAKRSKG